MSQYLGDISAYALAVSQGYTGTGEEYAELMASYATVGQTAVDAKDAAVAAKTAAQTAATTATNKASEATTAAQTATTKAAEAQADADAAALDASQALSAASTATTKATEATTAAATATSAKTDAVAANTAAQSAKTAAQTAQAGAETAAASVQSSAAQIATNAEDISQLKSDLNQITVEKSDERQLYDNSDPHIINCYSNGLKFLSSNSHRILYIPCEPNTEYTISADNTLWTANGVYQSESEPVANGDCESFSSRQDAIIVTENGRRYITNTTQANAHYLAVFYYNANTSPDTEANIRATIMIAKGGNRTEYIPYGELLYIRKDRLPSDVSIDTVYDRCITGKEATLETGDSIEFDSPNIKKNNLLTFSAIISNFGSLKIGQGRNALNQTAYIVIDATTVKVYRYTTEPVEWISLNHGLTIQDYIDVSIEVSNTEIGWAKLTVSSNGQTYTYARMAWLGCGNVAYAEAVSGSYTNCVLKHYCADYDKEFWLFGDSYFDHWVTPALADGYNNFLCDGWSGRRAEQALPSLQILLEHGKPKYIVWCLGMNNGDSSVAVNANWLTAYNTLVELCESNNINLILCTIPNTPSVNNNYKNAIIRNSGLQYIDLAKAVGSDISTSWYSDLLSTDNVHPSVTGDKMIAKFMETAIPQMFG